MPLPVLVVGPLAYDDVDTPAGRRTDVLGGSAAYASIAAAKYVHTGLVSVAGTDLRDDDLRLLRRVGVDVRGVERRDGRTLRWSGTYAEGFTRSEVRNTDLGVVAGWEPRIPESFRDARRVFLANTDPGVQRAALDQLTPVVVVLDTMRQWIAEGRGLDQLIARATVLSVNASELAMIAGHDDTARAARALLDRGTRAVIVKRGAAGATLYTSAATLTVPAYPTTVIDPTGAGDALAGAVLGRLAELGGIDVAALRDALTHGIAAASATCESFGVDALARADRRELERRAAIVRSGTGQGDALYEDR
ncbi:MAG: hypothetical protein QOH08_1124 [Chloroflexota bacterium]|jgi:sugar/nucleoside kinase (ribokinase family)|nr:hypothetical protein [Chloroflexota bacterium]